MTLNSSQGKPSSPPQKNKLRLSDGRAGLYPLRKADVEISKQGQHPKPSHTTDNQTYTHPTNNGYLRTKSFLLKTVRYYPSNHFLSYWKLLATIRETFGRIHSEKSTRYVEPDGTEHEPAGQAA